MASYSKWIDVCDLGINKVLALPYTDIVEVLIEVHYTKSQHYPATWETPEEPSEIEIEDVYDFLPKDAKGNFILTSEGQDKLMLKYMKENIKYFEESLETWAWEDDETNTYY